MKKTYTVEVQTGAVRAWSDDTLDAFAAAVLADRKLRGPAPSASPIARTLSVRTAIDAGGPVEALEAVVAAVMRAAAKAEAGELAIADALVVVEGPDGQPTRDELMSGADVARQLDISRERVRQLEAEPGRFPAPIAQLGDVHVWRWGDVDDWVAAGGRRPTGRPPMTFAAIALGLSISKPDRNSNWYELRRRMIDRANSGELEADQWVKINQREIGVFHDGLNWVDDRPDATVRVPSSGTTRADAEARIGRKLGR